MEIKREKTKVAILGSGNIGTDLMVKVLRKSQSLELRALAGIDPDSDGLARARRMGVAATAEGIDGLTRLSGWDEIRIVFDATSARAHARHYQVCRQHGKIMIDLTPAAIGPYIVPPVNLDKQDLSRDNLNMVTCGGQATIPVVAAVAKITPVHYAEIIASIASASAGPGTRANIDEFTETTARGIEQVGGAAKGKAIIILNPAQPPLLMRDTVHLLSDPADRQAVSQSIEAMVARVQQYVPGYRLKQQIQFETLDASPVGPCLKISVFLEVEGAGHYLPKYAGNLDIMTSAALHTAEQVAAKQEVAV